MAEHRNIDERIDAIAQSVELLTIDVHQLQAEIKVQFELSKHLLENSARQAEAAARQAEAAARQAESIQRLEATVKEDHKSIQRLEATVREDHKSIQLLNAAILKMTEAESRMMDTLERVLGRTENHETRIQKLETQ